ncbi:hypothetical protein CEXT_150551 [Caerostris extrusa]|uniref:Uncharacterized protein n=1 Tax=Caerostris extrusa TaxID=172846 RepID=A0AAV4QDQ1_CAEEX|nr:hypothetical protein CEXT_150551 [Caerostris extrusa]
MAFTCSQRERVEEKKKDNFLKPQNSIKEGIFFFFSVPNFPPIYSLRFKNPSPTASVLSFSLTANEKGSVSRHCVAQTTRGYVVSDFILLHPRKRDGFGATCSRAIKEKMPPEYQISWKEYKLLTKGVFCCLPF